MQYVYFRLSAVLCVSLLQTDAYAACSLVTTASRTIGHPLGSYVSYTVRIKVLNFPCDVILHLQPSSPLPPH